MCNTHVLVLYTDLLLTMTVVILLYTTLFNTWWQHYQVSHHIPVSTAQPSGQFRKQEGSHLFISTCMVDMPRYLLQPANAGN